jgi:uncharacterized protein YdhG (YjbR/CyaY superfamily)
LLQKVRQEISKTIPEAQETISYQMPTFDLYGKHIVHFAGYKNHIGLYPTPSGITKFEKELSIYKSGKGSAQFPLTEPLPFALIKKIVEFRVEEVKNKIKEK